MPRFAATMRPARKPARAPPRITPRRAVTAATPTAASRPEPPGRRRRPGDGERARQEPVEERRPIQRAHAVDPRRDPVAELRHLARGLRVQAFGGVDERRRAEADKVQAHRNDGNAERDASHRPWLPGGGGQVTFTTATAGRRRRSSASAFSRYPGSRDSSVTFTLYSGFENSGYEPSSSTGKSASTPFRCSASVPSPIDTKTFRRWIGAPRKRSRIASNF